MGRFWWGFFTKLSGEPERIKCAAVRCGWPTLWYVFYLPRPNRHCHILWKWPFDWGCRYGWPDRQGFITTHGRFVGRKEAGRIAVASGQIERLQYGSDLYSEDLW